MRIYKTVGQRKESKNPKNLSPFDTRVENKWQQHKLQTNNFSTSNQIVTLYEAE